MIGYMFAETSPVRAIPELRCDRTGGCDEVFEPRSPGWDRDVLRKAAAREAAWTQDEVGRDHCGHHRSVYAAQRMQEAAEATYPEAHQGSIETRMDIPLADVAQLAQAEDTDAEDQEAADKFDAAYDKATDDEEKRKAYLEAGALNLAPQRGKHHRKPETTEQAPKTDKAPLLVRLGLIAREPLVLDGDIDISSEDTGEWLAPLQRGGTQADRKLRKEFDRRGGWLGRPRKPRSQRKRHQKALTEEAATNTWGTAA